MSRKAVRSLLIAGIIASGTFAVSVPAFAADDLSCGDAVLALLDATKAAVSAKNDDDAVIKGDRLNADVTRAVSDAVTGGVPVANQTQADFDRLTAELAKSDTTDARKAEIRVKLPLIKAVVDARAAAAAFFTGGVTIEQLRETAGKTDAVELESARVKAKDAADKACKGADGVTPAPAAPQVVVVPNTDRGVDTGSW